MNYMQMPKKSAYQNGLNIPKKFAFAKAKFFREIGYADELGSGFIKITKNSILYSGKPPIFEDKEMLRVTIPLLRDEKLEEKDLINLANGTLKIVFEKISNKNNITQKEISEETGILLRTVKKNIEILKENGYIERIGARKNGYWIIK